MEKTSIRRNCILIMKGIKRELFPILQNKRYFNTCSVGALAKTVREAAYSFLEDWDTLGGLSWTKNNSWMDQVEYAKKNFAKLIGAKSENIAFMFGNSTAIASIMSSFPFKKGDEVIFNDLDFPAVPANIMARNDYEINYKVAKSNNNTINADDYRLVIGKKTKLITACEVVSNTGFKINTEELIETAHERDIPVFLDTYQSTGTIPLDVKENNVDFLASGTLKYLIGGFGISFLYIRDDRIENLNPGSIGWMGVDSPFTDLYDKLRTEKLHRPSDATKFQFGTPYPVGAVTAKAGMDLIYKIGVKQIHRQNMRLTQKIIDRAMDGGLEVLTPVEQEQRGSIVNIQMDNPHDKVRELQSNSFVLDARANGIRIAPHFYNDSEDIEKLMVSLTNNKQ